MRGARNRKRPLAVKAVHWTTDQASGPVRPKFQGDVFFQFIQPCNPVTAKSVPAGDDWLHEPKLDGYRLQVAKEGHGVRLYSRRGHDWSKRLAVLAEALRGIPAHSAVGTRLPRMVAGLDIPIAKSRIGCLCHERGKRQAIGTLQWRNQRTQ
jgi:hypothetical protein